MPAVTISSGYGTGGSVVARQVADRLGWQLLDRAISSKVAAALNVTSAEAEDGGVKRSFVERFFGVLAPLVDGAIVDPADNVTSAVPALEAAQFREQAERIVRAALPDGVVVLGRAGSAMLRNEPGVLRVRLFGPDDARVAHAAAAESIDRQSAQRRLTEVDRARAHYVKRLYECDIDDPQLYHLQIDGTAVPAEACAAAIVDVYTAFAART